MHEDISATSTIKIIETPSIEQMRAVVEWLADDHSTPDLQLALYHLLKQQIVPHQRGGLVAIAYTECIVPKNIKGVMMIKPGNNLLIESSDYSATESLLAIAVRQSCPHRVFTSALVKSWIRPLLLKHYSLRCEYDQFVMICTQPSIGGEGRWALPQDFEALHAYAIAYSAERGSGSLNYDWDSLIQQRVIAVLENSGQIASIVRYSATKRDAFIIAPFTFSKFLYTGICPEATSISYW